MTSQELTQADIGAAPTEYSQGWMLRTMVAINLALKTIGGRAPVTWHGDYDPGKCYSKGAIVIDDYWLMIANKDTCDRPAPQKSGPAEWDIPDTPAGATEEQYTGAVSNAHEYLLSEPGWLNGIDIWPQAVGADIAYTVTVIAANGSVSRLVPISLTAATWNTIAISPTVMPAGDIFKVALNVLNSSSTTSDSGSWRYDGMSNNAAPGSQGWNRSNQDNVLRIDKTDLASTDRTADLMAFVAGTTVSLAQAGEATKSLKYYVEAAPVNAGSYIEYPSVILESTGIGGQPDVGANCGLVASIPVVGLTRTVTIEDYWVTDTPPWGTVTGAARQGGVADTGREDDAFGIRVNFQRAYVSPDWDYMAHHAPASGLGIAALSADSPLQVAIDALPGQDSVPVEAGDLRAVLKPLIEAIGRISV